jgi:hypothetical protein
MSILIHTFIGESIINYFHEYVLYKNALLVILNTRFKKAIFNFPDYPITEAPYGSLLWKPITESYYGSPLRKLFPSFLRRKVPGWLNI